MMFEGGDQLGTNVQRNSLFRRKAQVEEWISAHDRLTPAQCPYKDLVSLSRQLKEA